MKAVSELCINDLQALYLATFGGKPEQTTMRMNMAASWGNEGILKINQTAPVTWDIEIIPAREDQPMDVGAMNRMIVTLGISDPATKFLTTQGK